jgi:phosphoribosylaminoimidazole-succinocarboxamide synthase
MELLGEGSVKSLYWDERHPKLVCMRFSDRVSVFDYGSLPESIPFKGNSLERSARAFFNLFAKNGIPTAFDVAATDKEKNGIYLSAARGGKFLKDHSATLEFIPLEVIFRWGVPEGSSLIKRGFKQGEKFTKPLVEFTTKLESADRLLEKSEATELAGGTERFRRLEAFAENLATLLRDHLKKIGLELWDGKIECAWDTAKSEVVMVDTLGPDELRVTLPGLARIPLSKELLRRWLSETSWSYSIRQAKEKDARDWKKDLSLPPRLGDWRVERFATLYQAFAQSLEDESSEALWNWVRKEKSAPKVYVLGGGGREAALRWRLEVEGCELCSDPKSADAVWVSMDADLATGKVNEWQAARLWTYGPLKEAAQIEWSKLCGREVAEKSGIRVPKTSEDLKSFGGTETPVVKKDGLAAGKGVVVPQSRAELENTVKEWSAEGAKLLFEEKLKGPEASAFFAVSTGYYGSKVRLLGTAQDFKRRFAGDEGPNTGGMGAYCPSEIVAEEDLKILRTWAEATAQTLGARGIPYHGILYLGLMKDESKGWVLLEYNARFGDPETQALVMHWPREKQVLRTLLGLSVEDVEYKAQSESQVVCLALVRPEYPAPAPQDFKLPEWKFSGDKETALFRAQSLGGRVAYLVASGASRLEAGDKIFQAFVSSPWKNLLDWRRDILP